MYTQNDILKSKVTLYQHKELVREMKKHGYTNRKVSNALAERGILDSHKKPFSIHMIFDLCKKEGIDRTLLKDMK